MISITLLFIGTEEEDERSRRLSLSFNRSTMVYGVIRSVQAALKYRGGWRGLWEHMYTVSVVENWVAARGGCFGKGSGASK
jgi:hypothetical protein